MCQKCKCIFLLYYYHTFVIIHYFNALVFFIIAFQSYSNNPNNPTRAFINTDVNKKKNL